MELESDLFDVGIGEVTAHQRPALQKRPSRHEGQCEGAHEPWISGTRQGLTSPTSLTDLGHVRLETGARLRPGPWRLVGDEGQSEHGGPTLGAEHVVDRLVEPRERVVAGGLDRLAIAEGVADGHLAHQLLL